MDLYNWLRCEQQNGNEDNGIALINTHTMKAYQILVNDLHSRDWFYMVPYDKAVPVYYQISYLLKDVDKKLLEGYYVTEVREEKSYTPFRNGICYRVMIDEMAPATQLKGNYIKGGPDIMVTVKEWLEFKKENGKENRRVTFIYDDFIIGCKRARIKVSVYERHNYIMSTIVDEKCPEYYQIDYLLRFINNDFLDSYYITRERLLVDNSPFSDGAYYELTVTDKLCIQQKRITSNSHYGINPLPFDPISADDHYNLRKELSRIALDGFWGTKKRLEIKKVICDGPATIIFWKDGTKTVVKCDKDDVLDYEKGILYAALKKLCNKKEYNDILRAIDAWNEFNKPLSELFPDLVEVEKPKKAKKVYKRKFGDSDQNCPNCGQNWVWSGKRRLSFFRDGFINITCRNCGHKFRYVKGGRYESQ